jgi:Family of unknown function (DUF6455)
MSLSLAWQVQMSEINALSHPALLGHVLNWMRAKIGAQSEITALSREQLRVMAQDLSLAESDLLAVATRGHDNTVLMEGMIRAHGFDPDKMRPAFAMLLRDVERVCSQCKRTGTCRRELDAGTATENYHNYCPNAATFDDLIGVEAIPRFP